MTPQAVVPASAHERRRIAVAACVDPRTIERFLAGLPIRSTCAARIAQALAELKRESDHASTPGTR